MSAPRLYVAGPMTGLPEFNYPAFEAATIALVDAGYDVSSPHEVNVTVPHGKPSWLDYMRATIPVMLDCDAVAALPEWPKSRGAKIEIGLARRLGLPVRALDWWLEHPDYAAGA